MKDVEEKLDSRFYRCHKSYIVNKDNIEEIDVKKRIIYMKNGEECLVSIRHMKNLIGD
ncbi:accessory protein regulator protein A [compost metagenome]